MKNEVILIMSGMTFITKLYLGDSINNSKIKDMLRRSALHRCIKNRITGVPGLLMKEGKIIRAWNSTQDNKNEITHNSIVTPLLWGSMFDKIIGTHDAFDMMDVYIEYDDIELYLRAMEKCRDAHQNMKNKKNEIIQCMSPSAMHEINNKVYLYYGEGIYGNSVDTIDYEDIPLHTRENFSDFTSDIKASKILRIVNHYLEGDVVVNTGDISAISKCYNIYLKKVLSM